MKRCADCAIEKDEADFNKKGKWRQPYCKPCQRERNRQHYKANRTVYICRAKAKKVACRDLLRKLKDKPCRDCGVQYEWFVMQFDHLPGHQKVLAMAQAANDASERLILEEAEKCDVVCANCHARRTHQRKFTEVWLSQV